jgi:hypothetical protein
MNLQLLEAALAPHISGTGQWCASRSVRLGISLFAMWLFATAAFALDSTTDICGSERGPACFLSTASGSRVLSREPEKISRLKLSGICWRLGMEACGSCSPLAIYTASAKANANTLCVVCGPKSSMLGLRSGIKHDYLVI